MKRRSTFRSIPPWWAEPIVFIPTLTLLSILVALGSVIYVHAIGRP